MNWEALGAIGEIVGAVAVILTLGYLALQIRQNTAAVATSTYDSVITGYNELNLTIASDPDLARIVHVGMYTPSSLDENERIRFAFIIRAVSNQYLKLLRLHEKGALPPDEWKTWGRELAQIYRTPGGSVFRSENLLYGDLCAALDKLEVVDTSTFRIGDSGAMSEGEGAS
jgi:hypothetical protein